MEIALIKIKDIIIDKELYPRISVDWTTCARYYNAFKSGAVFPPIAVAKLDGIYYLVDGAHRLKIYSDSGEEYTQSEVLYGLSKEEIYLEAVKRNIGHGRQFSTQEVTNICITLEKWNLSKEKISELVNIPMENITPFIAKRSIRITDTGERVALKAPLRNLIEISPDIDKDINQKRFNSKSQVQILEMVISLLKNGWINNTSEIVIERLKKIYELLKEYNFD